jgi:hypothetical protein
MTRAQILRSGFPIQEVTESGQLRVSDPRRGIGLVVEPPNRPLLWMVYSVFRRIDNGQASEPFLIEYGKN